MLECLGQPPQAGTSVRRNGGAACPHPCTQRPCPRRRASRRCDSAKWSGRRVVTAWPSVKAIMAFRRAIEIDSDYELAYNSLALTQRTSGELDKALYNYDAGAKALARRIVKAMRNSRSNPILKIAKRLGNYGSNMQAMPRCIWV